MKEREEEPAIVPIPTGSLELFEAMIYELLETYIDLFTRKRIEARQESLRRSSQGQTSCRAVKSANEDPVSLED